MRPRSDDRGNQGIGSLVMVNVWPASMRPRSDDRGNPCLKTPKTDQKESFNEAAIR